MGGGGTLICSYSCTRRLGPILWVHNFEFQYFWGISDKMNREFCVCVCVCVCVFFFGGGGGGWRGC